MALATATVNTVASRLRQLLRIELHKKFPATISKRLEYELKYYLFFIYMSLYDRVLLHLFRSVPLAIAINGNPSHHITVLQDVKKQPGFSSTSASIST
jgi:hypothetical protein